MLFGSCSHRTKEHLFQLETISIAAEVITKLDSIQVFVCCNYTMLATVHDLNKTWLQDCCQVSPSTSPLLRDPIIPFPNDPKMQLDIAYNSRWHKLSSTITSYYLQFHQEINILTHENLGI
jgi:hypothetical protein